MGISLNGKGRWLALSFGGWTDVRSLAQAFGWEPLGTRPGPEAVRSYRRQLVRAGNSARSVRAAIDAHRRGWPGDYSSNDGQLVTATDARRLARALAAARDAIVALDGTDVRPRRRRSPLVKGIMRQLSSFADPDSRKLLTDVIAFCLAGSFTID